MTQWTRDGHLFINDLDHRRDVMTCGLLSLNLTTETRGLAVDFILLVWLREGTQRARILSCREDENEWLYR